MSRLRMVLLLALICLACGLSVGEAAESGWDAVGIRVGADLTDAHNANHGDFVQYELCTDYLLPLSWRISPGLELRTRLDAGAGLLTRQGTQAFLASLGPGLALEMFSGRAELSAGGAATYLSRHSFPGRDLGGPFLFTISGGIVVYVYSGFGVGYHYEHLSNAYIYDHNPGLNLHMLELKYRF
jgi:lipid A 3-O-deacylase